MSFERQLKNLIESRNPSFFKLHDTLEQELDIRPSNIAEIVQILQFNPGNHLKIQYEYNIDFSYPAV